MNQSYPAEHDLRLIAATLSGDQSAFGELVCRHQDRLINSLFHLMGNDSDAHDVAQDAFLLALTRLSTFRGQSSFFTWLFRIARNVAISRFRRDRKMASIDATDDQQPLSLSGPGPAPDDRITREEEINQVRTALSRLSDEHRVILVLREMEDLDYDQIADALEIPIGTVRSRLHRARLQLKTELESLTQSTETK